MYCDTVFCVTTPCPPGTCKSVRVYFLLPNTSTRCFSASTHYRQVSAEALPIALSISAATLCRALRHHASERACPHSTTQVRNFAFRFQFNCHNSDNNSCSTMACLPDSNGHPRTCTMFFGSAQCTNCVFLMFLTLLTKRIQRVTSATRSPVLRGKCATWSARAILCAAFLWMVAFLFKDPQHLQPLLQ